VTLQPNTQLVYSSIGNREDLTDVIYNIDPTETPFITSIERIGQKAILHEWQTQVLTAPDLANAQLEGDDTPATPHIPTVRLGNYCQISRKTGRVSGTQRAVDHAGRDDELDYQKLLKGKELKRDMESILCSNQAKAVGAAGTARKLASLCSWVKTNTNKGAAPGADPAAADGTGVRVDGVVRAYTEILLQDVLQKCWTNGGEPNMIMLGGLNKQRMSAFTGRAQAQEQAVTKKIVNAVNTYEGDFGTQKVVPNRFSRPQDVWVLQTNMWAVSYVSGRRMVSENLAKTGDSEAFFILSEYSLEARNEKASGLVADTGL
jgi:Family of unknown function (DUF5309)